VRCPTTRGRWRCPLDLDHDGECDARDGEPESMVTPRAVRPAAVVRVAGGRCPTCDQPMPEKTP